MVSGGKRVRMACKGCSTEEEARAFARRQKALLGRLKQQRTARALVENFREELTGGHKVPLDDAYDLAAAKPARRKAGARWDAQRRRAWADFREFLREKHPDALWLSDVTKPMAEEYISLVRSNGRYIRTVHGEPGWEYENPSRRLAAKTCNDIQIILAWVFKVLRADAGLLDNPFDGIPKAFSRGETREAFTPGEVRLILASEDRFAGAVFLVAMLTGLREGDVCTLRWREVDLDGGWIRRVQRKTSDPVSIPVLPRLREFLEGLPRRGEYVLPEHAEIYLRSPSSVSARTKSLLESLGIETTRGIDGRDRRISVRDVHSCRHTFATLAVLSGVPDPVIQSILGWQSPTMLARYTAHITDAMRGEYASALSSWFAANVESSAPSSRVRLIELARSCPDELLEKAIAELEKMKKPPATMKAAGGKQ